MPTRAQQELIFTKLGYRPSDEQWAVHASAARIRLVAGGERGGKSYSSANDYLSRFWETPLLWLVAADYERTRAEFDYICEGFDKLGIGYNATKQVNPGEINVQGGFKICTVSAKDPRRIAMVAPDGVLGCEASQLDYETYLRLRGRIAEHRGWILLSGTFESSLGWYPSSYLRWRAPNNENAASFSLPTWSNLAIFPGGRQDPEILALEADCSKEWFLERYGGVPCPPKGLVFDEFRNEIHAGIGGDFEYDAAYSVYPWVDPGFDHYYAVLAAQKKGDDIYIIDEIYERGLITSQVVTIAQQKPWWKSVATGAIDVAGTQHQAMAPPAEVWLKEGKVSLRSQRIKIVDGIERVKSLLRVNPITNRPRLFVNARCRGLISELGGCANPHTDRQEVYKWKTDKDGNVLGDQPEDKNNDACKALCYGTVDLIGFANRGRLAKARFF